MTTKTITKYSMMVAGWLYILFGVIDVVVCVRICLTDDRRGAVVISAILFLVGIAVALLGLKRLRDAKRTA
jgi:uncharacterized membrane protein YhaH (DUF805 family)